MSHTYISELVHCVFSTKERRNLIPPEIQPELWAFLGGIARKNGFKALVVGGTANHVHVLLSLPATMPLAKAVQLLKGVSSRWMNEKHTQGFAWQEGYGAFTVGISQKDDTIAYIRSQAEHHRKRSFEEEFVAFLKRHNVELLPGVETPGYCQTVPPGSTSVHRRGSGKKKCARNDRAGKSGAHPPQGPVGTAENSPPVHWRVSVPNPQTASRRDA